MGKVIYTPFTQDKATGLLGRLAHNDRIQAQKNKPGKYRGFKKDEYAFSTEKKADGPGYQEPKVPMLATMLGPDDQVYINAHGRRGLHELGNNEKCDADKVGIDDLIAQLKAQGLSETSKAKIKLWVCESAQGDKQQKKESFAAEFSKKLSKAGFKDCRVFGYTESVFAEYKQGADEVYHKRSVRTIAERLNEFLPYLKQADQNDRRVKAWNAILRSCKGDEEAAKAKVAESDMTTKLLLGEGHGGVGGRAKNYRKEFKDGHEVPAQSQSQTLSAAAPPASSSDGPTQAPEDDGF